MTAEYVRVRVMPHGSKAFTTRLEIVRDDTPTGGMLVGYEVNDEGARITPPGGTADLRLRVIAADCIVKRQRLEWNRTYGTLEASPPLPEGTE